MTKSIEAQPLRASELTPCDACGQGLTNEGQHIHFYRLIFGMRALDLQAAQRQHGLELMMGGGQQGAVLAHAMGPDPAIGLPIGPDSAALICSDCAMRKPFMQLIDEISAREEKKGDTA